MKNITIQLLMIASLIAAGNLNAQKLAEVKIKKPNKITEKLGKITLPTVNLSNVTLEEAVDYLRVRSRALDPKRKPGHEGLGINFVLHTKGREKKVIQNLSAKNVSMATLIKAINEKTGTKAFITEDAVIITEPTVKIDFEHQGDEPNKAKVLKPEIKRLKETIIPLVDFKDTSLDECMDFLRLSSYQLGKGFNFVNTEKNLETKMTLRLSNVSLLNTLRYVSLITNTKLNITKDTVFIIPRVDLHVKKWGRLSKIIIPSVSFTNVSPEDALVFIRDTIKNQNSDYKMKIILDPSILPNTKINMRLKSVATSTVLERLATACNATCYVSPGMVLILPKNQKVSDPEAGESLPAKELEKKKSKMERNPFLRNGKSN